MHSGKIQKTFRLSTTFMIFIIAAPYDSADIDQIIAYELSKSRKIGNSEKLFASKKLASWNLLT